MMKTSKKRFLLLLSLLTALCLTMGAVFAAEGTDAPAEGTPFSLSDDFRTAAAPNYVDSLHVSNTQSAHGLVPTDAYGGTFDATTGWIVYRLAPAEGMFDALNLNVSGVLWGGDYGGDQNEVRIYASADPADWGTALYTQSIQPGTGASTVPFDPCDLTAPAKGKTELYVKIELAHVAVNTSPTYCGIKLMTVDFAGTTVPDGTVAMTPVTDDFTVDGTRGYLESSGVFASGGAHGMVPAAVWGGTIDAGTGSVVYQLELPNEGTFAGLALDMTARVSWTNEAERFKDNKINVYASADKKTWGEPLYTAKADGSYTDKNLSANLSAFAKDKSLVYVKIELVHAPASVSLTYTGVKLFTVRFTGKYLPGPETTPYEVNYELDEAGLAGLDEQVGGFKRYTSDGADYTYCTAMYGSLVKKFSADEGGLMQFRTLKLTMRSRVTVYGGATPTQGALKISVSPDGQTFTLVDSVDSDRDWATKSLEYTLSQTVRGWKDVYVKLEFANPNANSGDWTAIGNLALSGGTEERSAFDILYYNVDNATHDNPAGYERGSAVTLGDAARTGYVFAGWYADEGLTRAFSGITAETRGDVKVYAKWTAKTFSIALDPNGGVFADGREHTLTGTYDAPISVKDLPAEPAKDGMAFVGWYLDAAGSEPWIFADSVGTPTIVDGSVLKLYAKYAEARVDVTFDYNDGATEDTVVAYEKGQTAVRPADPERAGYRFGGWTLGGAPYDFATELTESVTLTAVWHKIYALTFEGLQGGTHANPSTYVETVGLTLADAERVGYRFAGWFDNAEFAGEAVAALDAAATGDKTFYAKWTVKEYALTVQAAHATVTPAGETIPYTGRTFALEVEEGYFLGEVTVNGTAVYVDAGKFTVAGIDGDVAIAVSTLRRNTLTGSYAVQYPEEADWQAKVYESYGLRAIPGEDRHGWIQVAPYGETYRGGHLVYRLDAGAGKTFNTVKVTGYARVFSFQNSAAALRLYVRAAGGGAWQLVKDFPSTTSGEAYTTLEENLTALVKGKQTVEIRLELESGFTDWVCLRDLGIEATYSTVIVKFLDGETQLGTNAKQVKGGLFTPLSEAPAKDGYEFLGWYLDSGLQNPAAETVVEGPLSVYAKWRLLTYELTYEGLEGAEHANPESYTVEDEVTFEPAERAGYKFLGWFAAADGSGEEVTRLAKGTTGDRTLYAKWLAGETIVYELDGGVNAADNPTVYFADEETALLDATREGYVFAGWYADAECTELVTAIAPGTEGTVTLYAKWIESGSGGGTGGCKSAAGGGTLALGLVLLAAAGLLAARRRRN